MLNVTKPRGKRSSCLSHCLRRVPTYQDHPLRIVHEGDINISRVCAIMRSGAGQLQHTVTLSPRGKRCVGPGIGGPQAGGYRDSLGWKRGRGT
jgi:hypothetical protein